MQVISFHPRYLTAVRSGRKTRTTRFNDPVTVGEAMLLFPVGRAPVRLAGLVTDVRAATFAQLTDEDARHEALEHANELRELLKWHYPTISDDDPVQVVSFHLI